jgi:hypothetical protein|tara:strand:+ start:235 stop:678 length:444 start_codon:yes stop_codon:yes gene_type:complete
MKQIQPDNLFAMFEVSDEEVYKEHGVTGVLKNPYVLMGMVIRGLENYYLMDALYSKKYPEEYKRHTKMVRYKYFTNLMGYLERIDWKDINEAYKISDSYDFASTNEALDLLKDYFEGIEYYEKCSIIKKSQDILYEGALKNFEVPKV